MKLIASVCTFILVSALSVWLLFTQPPDDVVAKGADVIGESSVAGPQSAGPQPGGAPGGAEVSDAEISPISDEYAAAFVGLQRTFDVWRTQSAGVLTDPDLLAGALTEAQDQIDAEVAAIAAKHKEEREQAAADQRAAEQQAADQRAADQRAADEAARQQEQEESRVVSPPPVSPPDYDDDWDDDDDDDWDDDDDDDWDDDDD